MKSVRTQVLARIRGRGRGGVFVPGDFLDLGNRGAIDQALRLLVKDGTLRRLARGIYDFPKIHPRLGVLPPNLHRVAAASARSTGSRIQLSGAHAANQLGLSTQVPAKLVYLTDGPKKTLRIGKRTIEFRHVGPKKMAGAGTTAGAVLQAFHYLGPHADSLEVIAKLSQTLSVQDKKRLLAYVSEAPPWAQSSIRKISQWSNVAA